MRWRGDAVFFPGANFLSVSLANANKVDQYCRRFFTPQSKSVLISAYRDYTDFDGGLVNDNPS